MLEIRIILLSIDLKHLHRARSLHEKLHIGKILRLIAAPPLNGAREKLYERATIEDIVSLEK